MLDSYLICLYLRPNKMYSVLYSTDRVVDLYELFYFKHRWNFYRYGKFGRNANICFIFPAFNCFVLLRLAQKVIFDGFSFMKIHLSTDEWNAKTSLSDDQNVRVGRSRTIDTLLSTSACYVGGAKWRLSAVCMLEPINWTRYKAKQVPATSSNLINAVLYQLS